MKNNTNTYEYELMKEEESMNLIKIQNKKINTLINQLEQKESLIKQYESNLQSINKETIQNSTLQHQHQHHQCSYKPTYQSIETDGSSSFAQKQINIINNHKQQETKIAKLRKENSFNTSTIQKLNETITAQNNKIDSLLMRINDLNSIISNQENTISVRNQSKVSIEKTKAQEKQMQDSLIQKYKEEIDSLNGQIGERDRVNKKIINDNELFNSKYEEMNKRIKELIDDNKLIKGKNDNMLRTLQENDAAIQNYKSKLNQFEYLLNSKDSYHQECINEIEAILDRYFSSINQVIEWGNTTIGNKSNLFINYNSVSINDVNRIMPISMPIVTKATGVTDFDFESRLKTIYDNVVNLITTLDMKIKEEYTHYENGIHQQQNCVEQQRGQMKEMSSRIQYLEEEIRLLRDKSEDQVNNYSTNESYLQKSIEALNKKLNQYDINIDFIIKDFKRQFNEMMSSHQNDYNMNTNIFSFASRNSIDSTTKDINPINAISVLFNHVSDYCKWLINDNQLKKKLKKDNEMLNEENQKLIEDNMQLKKTNQSNGKQFALEKAELMTQLSKKTHSDGYERERAFAEEIGLLKEYISNHEEENERLRNDCHLLKNQYAKIEKAYEDLKKNQKQYE